MLLSPQQPPVPPLHRHDHPQPVASSSHAVPVVPKKTLFVNGTAQEVELADGRWKKYLCPHENCEKSFNRPGRLEEHLRSHSGEKPFACTDCDATFAREGNLKTHIRSHGNEEDKQYSCPQCPKKFWTNQHLKKHVEGVHLHIGGKGKTYTCKECSDVFKKHGLLRSHLLAVHSPEGSLPFPCTSPGCDRRFDNPTHLKAHVKTHDTSRYNCTHRVCLDGTLAARCFTTWSALQKHHKTVHPPICPYPECDNKLFTTARGLRLHLIIHEETNGSKTKGKKRMRGRGNPKSKRKEEEIIVETETEAEGGLVGKVAWEEADEDALGNRISGGGLVRLTFDSKGHKTYYRESTPEEDETDVEVAFTDLEIGPTKRVKVQETVEFDCQVENCRKPFKSATALRSHTERVHNTPPIAKRPPTKKHNFTLIIDPVKPPAAKAKPAAPPAVDPLIARLTGFGYGPSSNPADPAPARKIPCPFPRILTIAHHVSCETDDEAEPDDKYAARAFVLDEAMEGIQDCAFRFKRVYDLERHLRSAHGAGVDKELLEIWVKRDQERERMKMVVD